MKNEFDLQRNIAHKLLCIYICIYTKLENICKFMKILF